MGTFLAAGLHEHGMTLVHVLNTLATFAYGVTKMRSLGGSISLTRGLLGFNK
jgi:hypothetical protein